MFLLNFQKFKSTFYIFIFLLSVNFSSALQITEIQFDPDGADTDREWVEIYNETANSIDLTQIKFFEANVNHGIDIFNQTNSSEKNVNAGEYVVLAQDINKFKIDFPNYAGKIFKSSFSLSNTGESLALKDKDGNILTNVSYTESDKQASPSPGAQNSGGTISNTQTNNNTSSNSTTSNSTSTNSNTYDTNTDNTINYTYKSYWPETEKIYVKIGNRAGENMTVMQGQEIIFNPKVLDGYKKEVKNQSNSVQYKWSFGDGYTSDKREGIHSFKFVGEFVVNLQVNANGYVDEDKIYVKVVEPRIKVSIVSKEVSPEELLGTTTQKVFVDLVEIKNENNFELNVGGLYLSDENKKNFTLPEKLSILANKAILLPPELAGFASSTSKVVLSLGSGKVIAEFQAPTLAPSTTSPSTSLRSSGPFKGAQVQSATNTILNSNVVQVFTKEEFERQENISISNLISTTTKKIFLKKKFPLPNPPLQGGSSASVQIVQNVENKNKIEFKNQETFFDKLKNLWGF